MTEREQRALDWAIEHCPQEFIDALAERTAEVLMRKIPQLKTVFDTTLISTANGLVLAESEPQTTKKTKNKRFVKPTVEEVRAYCAERRNAVNAESFCNFYEANGWRVGKNPMKDWKASVRTWENRDNGAPPAPNGGGAEKPKERRDPFLDYMNRKVEGQ